MIFSFFPPQKTKQNKKQQWATNCADGQVFATCNNVGNAFGNKAFQ